MNLLGQEQHHTVLPSHVKPQLREVQNVYHCPLCARKGAYHAMVPHLQTHKLYSLNHAGFTIYRCNGGCVTRTHFHCCFCKRIYDRKASFLKHLPACELGKGSSIGGPSVPPPVKGPSVPPVKGPSVPPVKGPSVPPPVKGPSVPPVKGPSVPPVTGPSVPPVKGPSVPPVKGPSVPPVTDPSVPPVKGPSVPPVKGPSVPPVTGPSVPPVTGHSIPPPVTGPSIPPPMTDPSIPPPVTDPSVPPVKGPSVPPVKGPSVPPVKGHSIPPPVTGPSVLPVKGPSVLPVTGPSIPPPVTGPSIPPSVTGPTMLGQLLAVNEHKVLPLVWISDSKSIFAVTRTEPGLPIYPILFQNNSRRNIIETHHTVVPPDVEPQLREVQNVYHCPLCAREGDYAAMVPHLQSHSRYTIKHEGFTIHKCNDGCVRSSHFHCCFCNKVFVKRVQFLKHLRACELEKGTSISGPSKLPSNTGPSVPPTETGPSVCLRKTGPFNKNRLWEKKKKRKTDPSLCPTGPSVSPSNTSPHVRPSKSGPPSGLVLLQHHTVVPPDVEPQLREVQNVYHCPLCARKGDYAAMVPHLQSHSRYTIKHEGFTIHKCNDGCVRSSHFHCCFCNKVFVKRVQFLQHLRACELEKGTSISGPSKPPSNTGPSVPPTETGPSVCLRKTGPFNENRLWEKKKKRKTGPSLCPTGPSVSPSNTSPHVRPSKSRPSVSPSKSRPSVSPAQKKREWRVKRTLCGFCHLKLNVKNLKVHIKRRHPDKDVRDVVPPKKVCTAKVKKTICRFCHMELHEKNLKVHIKRRHSTTIVDLSEDDFLSFGCIDTKKGSFDTGPSYPSHQQYSGEDLMQDIIASVISHELTLD